MGIDLDAIKKRAALFFLLAIAACHEPQPTFATDAPRCRNSESVVAGQIIDTPMTDRTGVVCSGRCEVSLGSTAAPVGSGLIVPPDGEWDAATDGTATLHIRAITVGRVAIGMAPMHCRP